MGQWVFKADAAVLLFFPLLCGVYASPYLHLAFQMKGLTDRVGSWIFHPVVDPVIYRDRDLFIIQFDGSYGGNGGGAGAAIHEAWSGRLIWQGGRFLPQCQNNAEAEYEGLIFGLKKAAKENLKKVRVEGDCRLVIQQMKGGFRSRKLKHLFSKAKGLSEEFEEIHYHTIPREQNSNADWLAKNAVDSVQKLIINAVLALYSFQFFSKTCRFEKEEEIRKKKGHGQQKKMFASSTFTSLLHEVKEQHKTSIPEPEIYQRLDRVFEKLPLMEEVNNCSDPFDFFMGISSKGIRKNLPQEHGSNSVYISSTVEKSKNEVIGMQDDRALGKQQDMQEFIQDVESKLSLNSWPYGKNPDAENWCHNFDELQRNYLQKTVFTFLESYESHKILKNNPNNQVVSLANSRCVVEPLQLISQFSTEGIKITSTELLLESVVAE